MEVRPGYKQTEVGAIPDDWRVINIAGGADMITVGFVGSMAHLFTKTGVPLLRGQDVEPNNLNLSNTEFISVETHKLWKKSALAGGDVVIVRVGASAGMACVIPHDIGDANAASLVVIRPSPKNLDASFLSQLINSYIGLKQIESLLVGGAQPVINTGTASNFMLALPAIDVICQGSCHVTQAAFFTVLSSWRIGLSQTVSGRSQFRVAPRQRSG